MICKSDPESHCCWIKGQICEFLTEDTRCSLHEEWGHLWAHPAWAAAPVGQWFAQQWPGQTYDCGDWPQNIPEVMAKGIGLCCWGEAEV